MARKIVAMMVLFTLVGGRGITEADSSATTDDGSPCYGLVWYEGCQTCVCNLGCSRRECSRPVQRRGIGVGHSRVACVGGQRIGQTFWKNCNLCRCGFGGIEYCTLRDCHVAGTVDTAIMLSRVGCASLSLGEQITSLVSNLCSSLIDINFIQRSGRVSKHRNRHAYLQCKDESHNFFNLKIIFRHIDRA